MNKYLKKSISTALALTLACGVVLPVVGCGGGGGGGTIEYRNNETDAIVFSTEAMDKNFNPFFATSGPDTNIISQTQLPMLTTDNAGNIVCGENEATVALDYSINEIKEGGVVTFTDYEFVIKNGIKFSDGVDLTIKDVLFNLYVYLDPAYMGSATMYSTKILGLQAYRQQNPLADDSSSSSATEAQFAVTATGKFEDMMNYLAPQTESDRLDIEFGTIAEDLETLKGLFAKQLQSDWNACMGTVESYATEWRFTEDWEIFYYNEGLVSQKYEDNANGTRSPKVDSNGKFYTNLDDDELGEENPSDLRREMEAVLANSPDDPATENINERTEAMKEFAIQTAYDAYVGVAGSPNLSGLATLLMSGVGTELYDELIAAARTEYYNDRLEGGQLQVANISGITTTTKEVNGAQHDVLKIRIKGVDPKAIYNFAFGVAPMHIYSGKYTKDVEGATEIDYVELAKTNTDNTQFGVCFGDKGFFDTVLSNEAKNAVPVGAGPYMATNEKDSGTVDISNFTDTTFVYFKRNDNFHTVGSGINNAKIKYLRYRVVGTDNIMNALRNGEVDFGQPNAKPENVSAIADIAHLSAQNYETNGYGYIGINPKYVPDIEVRRAIMKTMDTTLAKTAYYYDLASILNRSMSSTSWVYELPKADGGIDNTRHSTIAYTEDLETIKNLVLSSGNWTLEYNAEEGREVFRNVNTGEWLRLTFTIAGNSKDHPAYAIFTHAEETLEQCGFIIHVKTDLNALAKLATGSMAVWAAAWSSSIDPDMYQVYHKDSTATSTKNWGYDEIYKDLDGDQFGEEQDIIDELSLLIESARQTNNKTDRSKDYAKALDLVMELAVELPTYQRHDLFAYNSERIDVNTLNQDATWTSGVIAKIWELNYYQQ